MKRLTKLFVILLIVTLLALALVVYKIYKPLNKNKSEVQAGNQVASTSEPLKVEKKTFTDQNDFYSITAEYPKDVRDKNNVIENWVKQNIQQIQNEWKIGGEVYNSEKQIDQDFPDRAKINYEYNVTYTTHETQNKKFVSYVLNTYQFTGGAHGMSVVNTFTFDKNGEIDIEEVLDLANGNGVKLTKLLAKKVLAQKSEVINETMLQDGLGISYLKSDGITIDKEKCHCDGFYMGSNFQKFYISDNGITFLFDPYQIAPYAAGIVEVTLSWEDLQPYLKNTQILDLVRS